jgi:hypothetical protein
MKERKKEMANKSMDWYVKNDDFEGAKERLENTSKNWKKKWFEVCKTIFEHCKELAKKYILDPFENAVKEISQIETKRKTKNTEKILVSSDCPSLLDEAKQKCYLFTFFDDNDNVLCSKVGTTTREIRKRLTEELNSDTYKKMGAVRAVIHRVYDCMDFPAEGLESYFRSIYIRRYPNSFKKNDRFINTNFDLIEADKIYQSYFQGAFKKAS